jgi:hypothetical protein
MSLVDKMIKYFILINYLLHIVNINQLLMGKI